MRLKIIFSFVIIIAVIGQWRHELQARASEGLLLDNSDGADLSDESDERGVCPKNFICVGVYKTPLHSILQENIDNQSSQLCQRS